jgi:hypothetical protein
MSQITPSAPFIATLAVAPITEVSSSIVATVVQGDLLRRYPTYQQSLAPYQPMNGVHLSFSDPERKVGYSITIEALKANATAPVDTQRDIRTPFTTQLTRELTQLMRQLERALQADRLRAALTACGAPVQAEMVMVTRAKFAGEAVALRLAAPMHGMSTLIAYAGGYFHALLTAADQAEAEANLQAFITFAQERQISLTLNTLKPFTAGRLVIEPLRVELAPLPDWLVQPVWQTYHSPKRYFCIDHPEGWVAEDATPQRDSFDTTGNAPSGKKLVLHERTVFKTRLANVGAYIDVVVLDNPPDPDFLFTPNGAFGAYPAMRDPHEQSQLVGHWYVAHAGVGFEIDFYAPVLSQPTPYQDYGLPATTPAESEAIANLLRHMMDAFHAPDADLPA